MKAIVINVTYSSTFGAEIYVIISLKRLKSLSSYLHFDLLLFHSGCWMTMRRYSRSGATMISCFFDRTRKKVKSFCGSKSRTQLRALAANWWRRPEYWTVVELSNVVLIGIPSLLTTITPTTPLCAWIRFSVSSTSLMIKVTYSYLALRVFCPHVLCRRRDAN